MSFANQRAFDMPATLLAAQGGDVRINPAAQRSAVLAADGKTVLFRLTNGGISNPQRTVLLPGTRLVRLGGGLPHDVASGAWWLEWSDYRKVERFADAKGVAVPLAVRLLCCVLLDWSAMTTVVQARLKLPLLAYEGLGAPAVERNPKQGTSELLDGSDAQALGIRQLYIPGMTDPDLRHDALMIEGYGHLPAEQGRSGYIIRPDFR